MEFNNDNNTVKRTCKNYRIVNQSYLFPAYITSALINSYIYIYIIHRNRRTSWRHLLVLQFSRVMKDRPH